MSELQTPIGPITEVAAPKAKRARKPAKRDGRTSRPKVAAKAKPSANGTITGVQYRVLKAIAATKHGLTRKQISEKAFGGNSINFVPILTPLIDAKMIRQVDIKVPEDGINETRFEAMAKGAKAAKGAPPVTQRGNGAASHQPLPKPGGTITKTYLGKEYKVKLLSDGFSYAGKTYSSLTATAKAIRKSEQEVNGWAFFGLTKGDK